MLKEFRDFLIKGNVVDMAVGFIFGAAFATLIKSLVANIIMPPIGLLLGRVDFSQLFLTSVKALQIRTINSKESLVLAL